MEWKNPSKCYKSFGSFRRATKHKKRIVGVEFFAIFHLIHRCRFFSFVSSSFRPANFVFYL